MLMMLASWGPADAHDAGLVGPCGPPDAHDAGLLGPCGANQARLMLMMLASWGHVAPTRPG